MPLAWSLGLMSVNGCHLLGPRFFFISSSCVPPPIWSSWNLKLQALCINIAVCLQPFLKLQESEEGKSKPEFF